MLVKPPQRYHFKNLETWRPIDYTSGKAKATDWWYPIQQDPQFKMPGQQGIDNALKYVKILITSIYDEPDKLVRDTLTQVRQDRDKKNLPDYPEKQGHYYPPSAYDDVYKHLASFLFSRPEDFQKASDICRATIPSCKFQNLNVAKWTHYTIDNAIQNIINHVEKEDEITK